MDEHSLYLSRCAWNLKRGAFSVRADTTLRRKCLSISAQPVSVKSPTFRCKHTDFSRLSSSGGCGNETKAIQLSTRRALKSLCQKHIDCLSYPKRVCNPLKHTSLFKRAQTEGSALDYNTQPDNRRAGGLEKYTLATYTRNTAEIITWWNTRTFIHIWLRHIRRLGKRHKILQPLLCGDGQKHRMSQSLSSTGWTLRLRGESTIRLVLLVILIHPPDVRDNVEDGVRITKARGVMWALWSNKRRGVRKMWGFHNWYSYCMIYWQYCAFSGYMRYMRLAL